MKKNKRCAVLLSGALFWAAGGLLALAARRISGFADAYADTMNAFWVNTLGRLSSSVPFSVCEILLYLLAVLVLFWLVRLDLILVRRRGGLRRHLMRAVSFLVLAGGICFFLYECGEDVYFYVTPFSEEYGFGTGSYTTQELEKVCEALVGRCNRYASEVRRSGTVSEETESLTDPVEISVKTSYEEKNGLMLVSPDAEERARRAVSAIGADYPELRGYIVRPKGVMLSALLSYAQFSGIWTAVTWEANYNRDMPEYNRPFSMCHELAHSKGVLRENEANLIAYLACSQSEDADFRYSAALSGWIYCGNELYRRERDAWKKLEEKLDSSVKQDLEANTAFWKVYEGSAGEAAEKFNNTYLQSKGVESGTESYDQVVDLILTWEERRS